MNIYNYPAQKSAKEARDGQIRFLCSTSPSVRNREIF